MTQKLQRDYLALLDPDEPRHGCAVLAEVADPETRHREAMAATLRQIVIDPLDWYLETLDEAATRRKQGRRARITI